MQNTMKVVERRRKVKPAKVRPYTPTVSVIITCYNYANYLPHAVRSCIEQKGVTAEIIIVDDASTDSSLSVATGMAEIHPNVSVLSQGHNTGPVEAFNHGARNATGEFLVRLDADDMLTPGSLSRATLVAQTYPNVGLVYGHPLHFSGATLPKPRLHATAWTIWPGHNWLTQRCRSGINVITSPEVLMRRAVLHEVGYQAALKHTHDMELWFRLSAFSDVAYIHGADQAWHREHPASLSASVDVLVDLRERFKAFEMLFQGPAGADPRASILAELARGALINEALSRALHELDRKNMSVPSIYAQCVRFARELDPLMSRSSTWQLLESRTAQAPNTLWAVSAAMTRRVLSRLKADLKLRRWHRNGVF